MGTKTMGKLACALIFVSCGAVFGCSGKEKSEGGGPGTNGDGDGDGDGDQGEPAVCQDNDDCSDEVFCNGEERCNPDHEDADAFGCIEAAEEPCSEGNSCDEAADECGCEDPDADGDGSESEECGGDDCDDNDANSYPGNEETCDSEHHDEDCDSSTYGFRDQDGDEDPDDECCNEDESGDLICGTDCNDNRGNQHSFNTEICDEVDNDCDGLVDESLEGDEDDGLKTVFTIDNDGDGWGSDAESAEAIFACDAPEGYVDSATDCDDDDNQVSPSATEVCDDVDNDCDGLTDESIDGDEDDGLKTTFTLDLDGDGFGSDAEDAEKILACSLPSSGYSTSATDCNDDEPAVSPSAVDSCNDAIDNDCSGVVNDPQGGCSCEGNETQSCALGGSVGKCATFTQQCNDGVWDDCPLELNSEPEVCDAVGVDENCDGVVNNAFGSNVAESLRISYYRDRDGDGYPDLATSEAFCPALEPTGWVSGENPNDCVDQPLATNPLSDDIHPDKIEVCNGYDDNCDDVVDGLSAEGDLELTFYYDGDNDGQAGSGTTMTACTDPGTRWHPTAQDCSDSNANIYFGAQEICNGADQDCDSLADADDPDASENCDVTGQIASAVCAVNACMVDECSGAYLDCDAAYDCETNGANDFDNCGECGVSCYQQCRASSCDEFVQVEGGSEHTCARTESGLVRCWGLNASGQVGDQSTDQRASPTATAVVSGAIDLSTSGHSSCAASNSTVWCWGDHSWGQLGVASPTPGTGVYSSLPLPVPGISSPVDISVGVHHACVVHNAGEIDCWGRNHRGQLGTQQASADREGPQQVLSVSNAIAVAVGLRHTCAIIGASAQATSGQVVCWGEDDRQQLGDGTTSHGSDAVACSNIDCSLIPRQVLGPAGNPQPLADAVALAAGWYHTCALRQSGQVVCWGYNSRGQLGDETLTSRNVWVNASGVSSATSIEANNEQTCAVNGGAVTCWGDNSQGQLGNDQTYNCNGAGLNCSATPVALGSPMNSATAVASGVNHSCGIQSSGRAYCWGLAGSGRLGNGTLDAHPTPYPVVREP
jgi:alpha-tubulin suppressor-like RCC1 family protein